MKTILIATVVAVIWCFYKLRGKDFSFRNINIVWIIYLILLGASVYTLANAEIYRLNTTEPWDFPCFYLYGKVADAGLNFYSPENFHQVYSTIHFPPSFYTELKSEVLDVGFPYPPPTILYFVPLGFMSYHSALIWWTAVNLCFVAGCIYLIYDQFFRKDKLNGLILITSLFFLFPPVRETVFFSQTNFIALFYILLIGKYSDKKFAGIFLALAIFTKPYMIILGLLFLLKKNWGAILYFILSCLTIIGITLLCFGQSPFLSYIFNNPVKRIPASVFSERIMVSLRAVLLRTKVIHLVNSSEYIAITLCILLLTLAYSLFLTKRKLYDFILPVLLLVGLLLYPGTETHYGVLLLFIIFQFFSEKSQLGFNNVYLNLFIVETAFLLDIVSVFSCICFLLIVIVLKSLKVSGWNFLSIPAG